MGNFVVITDSSSDLTQEVRERFDIEYVPGHITLPDGRVVDQVLEWNENYERKDFYARIRKGEVYSTSPASPTETAEVFKKFIKEGKDIVCLSISTALSGTYNFTLEAKEIALKEFPDAKIYCIDTLRYSSLQGLMCVYAAKLRDEGKTAEEAYNWLEENKNRFHSMGWVDDLKFLAVKGRMSNAKAFMGTLIGIKPLGENSNTGLTTIIGKAKGAKAGYEACLKYIEQTIENPQDQIVFVATTDREEDTLKYKQMIEERIKPKEVILTYIFPSCGVNIGPGLMCAYYVGKPISDDMKAETDLMTSILEAK
ncbi:MAG: DegV family protein [Lachnospiraceae bacterium]|nr:DegV family protein [Lachnospiraceae bacterium]